MNCDLLNYINSFDKISDTELFDIGAAIQSLPHQDQNWEEANALLKRFNNGKEYNRWYLAKKAAGTTITYKSKILDSSDTIAARKRDAQCERIKMQDASRELNRQVARGARYDYLIDRIMDELRNTENLPLVKYKGTVSGAVEAILMLSDAHIGNEFDEYNNTYNWDICQKRFDKLVKDTVKYCKLHKVKRLNVINLGDMINGIIHPNARIKQTDNVAEQVIKAYKLLSRTLNELQEAAPEITYRSCSDNHGRVSPNKEESLEDENFSKLIDEMLKIELRNNKTKVKFCEDNRSYSVGRFETLSKKVCMFSHGHQDKKVSAIARMAGLNDNIQPDIVLLAHYHNTNLSEFNGSKLFINGSIMGSDEYANSNRLFGEAEQSLLILDGNNINNILINLQEVK